MVPNQSFPKGVWSGRPCPRNLYPARQRPLVKLDTKGGGARPSLKTYCSLAYSALASCSSGTVGVGVFPVGEEILVGNAGLGSVALLLIDPAQFELCGNMSRWMIPLAWAASRASATLRAEIEQLLQFHRLIVDSVLKRFPFQ